jgi:hypothetical protein
MILLLGYKVIKALVQFEEICRPDRISLGHTDIKVDAKNGALSFSAQAEATARALTFTLNVGRQ